MRIVPVPRRSRIRAYRTTATLAGPRVACQVHRVGVRGATIANANWLDVAGGVAGLDVSGGGSSRTPQHRPRWRSCGRVLLVAGLFDDTTGLPPQATALRPLIVDAQAAGVGARPRSPWASAVVPGPSLGRRVPAADAYRVIARSHSTSFGATHRTQAHVHLPAASVDGRRELSPSMVARGLERRRAPR